LFKKKKDKIRKSGLKLNGGNKRWGPFAARFVRGINKRKYNKQSEEIKKKKKKSGADRTKWKIRKTKRRVLFFPVCLRIKKLATNQFVAKCYKLI